MVNIFFQEKPDIFIWRTTGLVDLEETIQPLRRKLVFAEKLAYSREFRSLAGQINKE
jgi:hypothetical protein